MNTLFLSLLLVSFTGLPSAQAIEDPPLPQLVNLVPQEVFVPSGFDSNDLTEIVVAGSYINTCFKQGPTVVKVDEAKMKITVQNQAYLYESCWCLQVIVPFQETVKIGTLKPGSYGISFLDASGKETAPRTMKITKAQTNEPDDFLYAPVNQTFIEHNATSGENSLTIEGTLLNDCMNFDEIRVSYRADKIIEVLPILSLKNEENCQPALRPFNRKVKLSPQTSGSHLVYIRSLNGQSMNRIFNF
jgi:hypothetical protein